MPQPPRTCGPWLVRGSSIPPACTGLAYLRSLRPTWEECGMVASPRDSTRWFRAHLLPPRLMEGLLSGDRPLLRADCLIAGLAPRNEQRPLPPKEVKSKPLRLSSEAADLCAHLPPQPPCKDHRNQRKQSLFPTFSLRGAWLQTEPPPPAPRALAEALFFL